MHIEFRPVLEPNNVNNVTTNNQYYIDQSKFTLNNNTATPLVASNSVVDKTRQDVVSRDNNWLVRLPTTTSSSKSNSDCSSWFTSTSTSSWTPQSQSIHSTVENASCDDPWELNPNDLELLELNLSEESPNSVPQLNYSPTNSVSAYTFQGSSLTDESSINSQLNTSSVVDKTTQEVDSRDNNWLVHLPTTTSSSKSNSDCSSWFTSTSTSSWTPQSQSIHSTVENASCDDPWELNPNDLELLELNLSEESPNSVLQLEYSATNLRQNTVQATSLTKERRKKRKTKSSEKGGDSEDKKPRNIFQVADFFNSLANIHKEIPEQERWLYWYKENEILKIISDKKDKIAELYAKIKGNKKSNYQHILRAIYDSKDFVKTTKEDDIGIHYTLKFTSRFISRSHISSAKYMNKIRSHLKTF